MHFSVNKLEDVKRHAIEEVVIGLLKTINLNLESFPSNNKNFTSKKFCPGKINKNTFIPSFFRDIKTTKICPAKSCGKCIDNAALFIKFTRQKTTTIENSSKILEKTKMF